VLALPAAVDFYDGDQEPVKNPERYFAVRDAGALIGFYYFERKGDTLEYGLGLQPELTGHGFGEEFSRAGLEFGLARFRPKMIILNVAAFNERAIKVYERLGFHEVGRHIRSFKRWGAVEFVEMEERREAA
jgi:ribosomal-protein-alanine N-acetyltransferase